MRQIEPKWMQKFQRTINVARYQHHIPNLALTDRFNLIEIFKKYNGFNHLKVIYKPNPIFDSNITSTDKSQ